MFVLPPGQEGFHYWYFDREGDHRFDFDGVVKSEKSVVARRTIATLTQNRVAHSVAEYPGTDVYLVAVAAGRPANCVKRCIWFSPSRRSPSAPATKQGRARTSSPVDADAAVGPDAPTPRHNEVQVPPTYHDVAVAARVEGVVTFDVTIGVDGKVTDAKVVRSIPILDPAALAAVRQWEFTPPLAGGRPRPLIVTVRVPFYLAAQGAPTRLARVSRGSVTGDRYENPFFGVHLSWPAEWRAIPDAELVRRGDNMAKAIQAIQAGGQLELFPAFPMLLLMHQPGGRQSAASIMVMAQSMAGTGQGAVQSAVNGILNQMTGPGAPVRFDQETIAGRTFGIAESSAATPNGTGTRRLYGTEVRGYAVIFLTYFVTEEESAAVRKALEQLRFEAR